MNVRFYLSNDIKITLKSHFCRINVKSLSICTQRCYGRHNVSRKSIYRFYCMALFHSQMRHHMIKIIIYCGYMAFRRLEINSTRPQDKSVLLKIPFLISQPKHVLWVLKRAVSMRRFFLAPKTHVLTDR